MSPWPALLCSSSSSSSRAWSDDVHTGSAGWKGAGCGLQVAKIAVCRTEQVALLELSEASRSGWARASVLTAAAYAKSCSLRLPAVVISCLGLHWNNDVPVSLPLFAPGFLAFWQGGLPLEAQVSTLGA